MPNFKYSLKIDFADGNYVVMHNWNRPLKLKHRFVLYTEHALTWLMLSDCYKLRAIRGTLIYLGFTQGQ